MFGELVPIPPYADAETVRQALGSFIQSHLLSSPQLEKTYTIPMAMGGHRPGLSNGAETATLLLLDFTASGVEPSVLSP